jgi:hypothetical protein
MHLDVKFADYSLISSPNPPAEEKIGADRWRDFR